MFFGDEIRLKMDNLLMFFVYKVMGVYLLELKGYVNLCLLVFWYR